MLQILTEADPRCTVVLIDLCKLHAALDDFKTRMVDGEVLFFLFWDETDDRSTPQLTTSGGNHTAHPAWTEQPHPPQVQYCPEGIEENFGLLRMPTNLSND